MGFLWVCCVCVCVCAAGVRMCVCARQLHLTRPKIWRYTEFRHSIQLWTISVRFRFSTPIPDIQFTKTLAQKCRNGCWPRRRPGYLMWTMTCPNAKDPGSLWRQFKLIHSSKRTPHRISHAVSPAPHDVPHQKRNWQCELTLSSIKRVLQ